jgi:hypothetical protein
MTSPISVPVSAKGLLAQLLRSARQQSQYRTQEALAAAIRKDRTTVGKNEQGTGCRPLTCSGTLSRHAA